MICSHNPLSMIETNQDSDDKCAKFNSTKISFI